MTRRHEAALVFDLEGATCPACIYAIEHLGRKVEGVHEVRVEASEHTVHVACTEEARVEVLRAIPEIVRRIGYRAIPRPAQARESEREEPPGAGPSHE